MAFPQRLAALRKERGLTQKALAEVIGISIIQVRRYEAGSSQPTLDVLRKLAVALHVNTDVLVFETHERGPDEDLRLQFEAVSRFDPEEKRVMKSVLEGLILKHEAKRWAAASEEPSTPQSAPTSDAHDQRTKVISRRPQNRRRRTAVPARDS
jgi:transcriptional regulator with XRE-family HTH domain